MTDSRRSYDTRETNDALGEHTSTQRSSRPLERRVLQQLLGRGLAAGRPRRCCTRTRSSAPYTHEYDTEQAALLEGPQGNLLRPAGNVVVVLCLAACCPGADPEDRPAAHRHPGGARALTATGRRCPDATRSPSWPRSSTPDGPPPDYGERPPPLCVRRLPRAENALAAIRLLTPSARRRTPPGDGTELVTDIGQGGERSRITEICPPDPAGQQRTAAGGGDALPVLDR
ncbi:MAG: hypothetical protein ACLTYN_11150 [Dysosmobacter welbionis]